MTRHSIGKEPERVVTLEINGYTCYVTKNGYGAWLAYVDVTACRELHAEEYGALDSLPFHGGCTYCMWTDHICGMEFDEKKFLIGCDWCHATDMFFGVETADIGEVMENLEDVVSALPELRLRMTVYGEHT